MKINSKNTKYTLNQYIYSVTLYFLTDEKVKMTSMSFDDDLMNVEFLSLMGVDDALHSSIENNEDMGKPSVLFQSGISADELDELLRSLGDQFETVTQTKPVFPEVAFNIQAFDSSEALPQVHSNSTSVLDELMADDDMLSTMNNSSGEILLNQTSFEPLLDVMEPQLSSTDCGGSSDSFSTVEPSSSLTSEAAPSILNDINDIRDDSECDSDDSDNDVETLQVCI